MLARKVVAGREQIKKLDKQLKDSQVQEPQKSEDSFKSSTEGEETVSSEIEQVSSGPKVTPETIFEVDTNLENMFVLVGSMAGVECIKSGGIGGKNKKGGKKKASVFEVM